jgi:hypothetical protein
MAMQNRLEVHETPNSPLAGSAAPGLGETVQARPFHTSTSARSAREAPSLKRLSPPGECLSPTATQNTADAHDTA